MKKRRKKKGKLLIRAGLLMLVAAALLSAYNVYEAFMAESAANGSVDFLEAALAAQTDDSAPADAAVQVVPVKYAGESFALDGENSAYAEMEIPDYLLNPMMEMPVLQHDGQDYIGVLKIPALNLKLPVISEWSYAGFRKAPCRYAGSAYTDDMVIAAHNYAAHFGNLNRLGEGAAVVFTDIDGNVFNYRVEMKETLKPRDVDYMLESGWDLSLFTCTPGGSYRVTVRCSRLPNAQTF